MTIWALSFLCASILSSHVPADAATLRGQVTDIGTGFPLEGAKIEIDLAPPDGTPEFEAKSGLFGFYTIADAPDGVAVRIRASRGGYTAVVRDATLSGDPVMKAFALARDAGPAPIDFYFTVVDASSAFPLADVPIIARWFLAPGDTVPQDTFSADTDENGAVFFFGMPSGYYDFAFNDGAGARPGWERYPKAGGYSPRQAINTTHSVNLNLKHVPQAVKIVVTGCDPRTEEQGPLEDITVEFTGVSPDDPDIIIIPPREGPTDEMGAITFFNLAPLQWRIRTKKMGFVQSEEFIGADTNTGDLPGKQPGGAFPVEVALEESSLLVILASFYDDEGFDFYEGIEVTLEGLEDSDTAGIFRTLDEGDSFGERLFEKLVPGRYTLRVNDQYEPDDPEELPSPHFMAETVVEIDEAEVTEFLLELDVRKAIVRVRLFGSDTTGNLNTDGGNDFALNRPIYAPLQVPDLQMGIGAEVIESATDENGDASFVVYPGFFGFAIPSLTDYYGSHLMAMHDTETEEKRQGWPTLSGFPTPSPRGGDRGEPLIISSDREYRIDLFANRKQVTFYLPIVTDVGSPTAQIVQGIPEGASVQCAEFDELLATPPTYTLTETGGGGSIAGNVLRRGPFVVAEFPNVTPGTWKWTGAHPRFDLSALEVFPGSPTDTTTVPEWPVAPGADYPPDPGAGFFYDPVFPYQQWPTLVVSTAKYKSTAPITITRMSWDTEASPPEYVDEGTGEVSTFEFIRPAYAGGAIFCDAGRPLGDFDFWLREPLGLFTASVTGNCAKNLTVYAGGPLENVGVPVPQPAATVTLKAISREAPDTVIPNVQFEIGGGGGATATFPAGDIAVPSQFNGRLQILNATDTTGKWLMVDQIRVSSGAYSQNVLLIAEMGRAINVTGTVRVNNSAAEPIPGAKVRLKDRFGDSRFPVAVTDKDGRFQMPPAEETPVFYVDVTAPGFIPKRIRIGGNDPLVTGGNSGQLNLDNKLKLDPLPPPSVAASIDRFGLFVSQLLYSNDGSFANNARAIDELTATWTATATPPQMPATYDEIPFDNPDGTIGEAIERTLEDEIVLVAIVDPRLFPEKTSEMAGNGAVGSPMEGQFAFDPDPDPNKVLARRKWWDAITTQQFVDGEGTALAGYHVLYSLAETLEDQPGDVKEATGKVKLWAVAPGVYSPFIVAETKHGALGVFQIKYEGAEADKTLRSLRAPAWFATLANLLAYSTKFSGSPALQAQLQERLPSKVQSGRFVPKRLSKGLISIDPENPGFIKYEYDMNAIWKEGPDAPGTGIVGLVAGHVGGVMECGVNVAINGKSGTVTLNARGQATGDKIATKSAKDLNATVRDRDRFKPKALSAAHKRRLTMSAQVTGAANTIRSEVFDNDLLPMQTMVRQRFFFGALTEARYDLKPYTKVIPYVGPVIRGIDKIDDSYVKIDAVGRAGIGVESITSWTTRRWSPPGSGSVIGGVIPHPELGHSLGGSQERPPAVTASEWNQQFGLCFNVGLGAEMSLGTVAGGSLFISLQGPDCTIPLAGGIDRPAAEILVGGSNRWPTVERISGNMNITLSLFLDVWVTRLTKKFSYDFAKFDYQYGTESVLNLTPISIVQTSESLAAGDGVEYRGTSPQLIGSLVGSGSHRIAAGASDSLLFADVDPATGEMVLKAAVRVDENNWGAPTEVARGAGIVAADIAELSDGSLLAVWSEIEAADLANPSAPSIVRSSRSTDAGANWSAPAEIASPGGVADRLFLEVAGALNGLVFSVAEAGPDSDLRVISGATFSVGGGWSAVTELAPLQEIAALAVQACTASITLAFVTGEGGLKASDWTGGAAGIIADGPSNVGASVSLANAGGFCTIAYLPSGGGIGTSILLAGTIADFGTHFLDESPTEVVVSSIGGSPAQVILAWADDLTGALKYGTVGAFGSPAADGAFEIAGSSLGRYTPVEAIQSPANHATILTRYTAPGAAPELRQFVISRTSGLAFDDRDGDTLSDSAELRIVDASTSDSILWIDDVLPGGDFDMDGSTNGAEIAAGTDPTNPSDRPIPDGVTVAATLPDAQEFGLIPGQFEITRSDSAAAVDVHFTLAGEAILGVDFELSASSPIHFEAGESSRSISVIPSSDSIPEGSEVLTLTIAADAAYAVGTPDSAVVTIADRPSDEWRLVFFPGNPAGTPFNGDSDGDGVCELAEFGLALDPNIPDANGLPAYGMTDDGQSMTLTYTRPIYADVIYTVEVASDLANWQSGAGYTSQVSDVINGDGTRTVTVRSLTPIGAVPRQQMRLSIRRE